MKCQKFFTVVNDSEVVISNQAWLLGKTHVFARFLPHICYFTTNLRDTFVENVQKR
jgi:hypothetical protein